jgi:hypothetical protein
MSETKNEEEQSNVIIPATREDAASYLLGILDVEAALIDTLVASGLVDREALLKRLQKTPLPELSSDADSWPLTEIRFSGGVLDVLRGVVAELLSRGLLDLNAMRAILQGRSEIWRAEGEEVRPLPAEFMYSELGRLAAIKKETDLRIAASRTAIKTDSEAH